MADEQEGEVRAVQELPGWRFVLHETLPIRSIQASLRIISNQRWGPFFLKLSLMGGVIFLTSIWFILTLLFVLGPMTQLSGSPDSVLSGFLFRLLIGALILLAYLWIISPALSQITEAEEVPDISGSPYIVPTRWVLTLVGFITLIGAVIIRYGVLEISNLLLPQAAVNPAGSISFAFTLLVFDMLYFGALMFGFGMVCLGRTYKKSEN